MPECGAGWSQYETRTAAGHAGTHYPHPSIVVTSGVTSIDNFRRRVANLDQRIFSHLIEMACLGQSRRLLAWLSKSLKRLEILVQSLLLFLIAAFCRLGKLLSYSEQMGWWVGPVGIEPSIFGCICYSPMTETSFSDKKCLPSHLALVGSSKWWHSKSKPVWKN
jgi:hypothetical protein